MTTKEVCLTHKVHQHSNTFAHENAWSKAVVVQLDVRRVPTRNSEINGIILFLF